MKIPIRRSTLAPLCALLVLACESGGSGSPAAGGSSSSSGGSASPAPGSERGSCYGNGTCNLGLTCFSNVCVSAGGGSGGTNGSGGNLGGGGVPVGSGGAMGTGGLETGGALGAGGSLDAGGSPDASCDGSVVGPPDWTLGGTPVADDPRWRGALGKTFLNLLTQGTPESTSRFIQSGGSLFMQLQALVDTTPGNTKTTGPNKFFLDSIYLGFASADLATVTVVRIAIDTALTPPTILFRWEKSGGAWAELVGPPAWLTAQTGWVNTTVGGVPVPWVVNVEIDSAAIPGPKVWYGMVISPNAFSAIHEYVWPDTGGFIEPDPPDTGVAASIWGAQFDAIGAAHWGDYSAVDTAHPRCGP